MNESDRNPDAVASPEPQVASVGVPVGSQLRQAREAAHLSRHEVAQALKFSVRQIEALEADNYGALPGATMVRGFVRSYARLLKLEAAPLLGQLEPVMPNMPAEVRPPENMGIASQPGVRALSPLVTLAIVLLLAAAMLALWHLFMPATAQVATTAITSGQMPEKPQEPATAPAENPVPAPVPVPVANAVPEANAVPAPPSAAPVLRFSFAARSWVEVADANKKLLHSAENPGGSSLTLTGKPPFDIVVGNASKVTLSYGEKSIDLAPHMRADVARLTLE